MSLKDFLKFEPVASPLSGATALTQSSRPTKSGVKLLAVPTNCLGYAFRVCNETLEILALSSEIGASILFSTSLGIPAVNVAASPDGRLVAVCLADGSLCCFDVTNESFQLRWKVEGAHSHTEIDLNQSVSTSRENAAGAAGPARSLQFSPQGYALALVDDGQQGLTIYHADDCGTPVESVQRQLAYLNLACAAWSPSCDSDECTIAVGTIDGNGIHVFNYNTATSRLSPVGVLPFPGEADDGPLWSCTHIEWVADGSSLGCGYCRVLPPEEDVKEDEDDPDDAAQHQVCFYISSFPSDEKPPQNMGDVVPFFAPAKDGRHVFFTTTVANNSQCNIMLVASNVGSDVHVLSGEDPSSWVEVELPEGDNASTPTDEDYEFTYPTGLAVANVIQEEGCRPLVLLLSTDGSLSCFQLVHGANESFFQLPLASGFNQLQAVPLPKSMRSEAAPELVREDASLPVADVKANLFGQETKASFGFGGLSLASTPPKSSLEASGAQQSVFGRSTFDQTISATIASTSSLSFGTGSAFGANVPSSTQPVFGQTSSLLGPQSAPFGSGSEVTFGSGSASLSFGSGDAKNVFGSSVLSSKPFSFGALASSPAGFAQSADPFNTFKKPASSAFGLSSITKPLFGTTTEEIKPEEQPELSSATMEAPSQVLPIEPAVNSAELRQDSKSDRDESASTPEAKKAAEAFDTIDSDKKGILPLNKMEDLIENLGEGFYGDELAKQTKLVDKDDKGHLERQAFIDWYVQLLSGGDDGGSSGGSEESDQREERERAQAKFQELSSIRNGVRSISEMDFPKLIESLGTTYCEEEHRRTIRKLKDSSGIITENAFVSWYIDWLFGGDESDVEDSEEEEDEVDGVVTNELVATGTGWGNIFKAEEGSWKCSVCMVLNPGETGKCKACEAVRPGTKNDATTASMGTGGGTQESSGSSIGANGFSFGGGAISSSGFSIASGGASSSPAHALAGVSSGFNFKPSGSSDASSSHALESVNKETKTTSLSSAFSPMSSQAPTPFSATNRETETASSSTSSAFPPMSSKTPTPFSTSSEGTKTGPTSSSSAFPPMSSKAPTPFSSAGTSAFGSSEPKSATSSSAFPPMSSKTPTPFSASSEGTKTGSTSSSSAFPPMSSKAPTPFSSAGTSAFGSSEPKSATSSSAFPPMSSKTPTPFSASSEGTKTGSTSSSSAFPPMSSKTPTPFSSAGTSAFGSSEPKSATSSSAFPPMSSKTPTPFSASSEGTKTGPTSSSSAFPPMSSKAPTPFSSAGTSAFGSSEPKSATSSSAFPPMSSKTPTPFSASSEGTKTGSTSSSSAFPPMSSKAPTPFSSAGTSAFGSSEPKSATSSSAFPPMSSKTPTPFSASSEGTKTGSTSSSSAFPPMSSKTPTPFSSAGTSAFGSSEPKSATSSSAFPPMSSKTPTPFSASSEGTKTGSTSSSSAFPPMSSKTPTPFSSAGTSAFGSSDSKSATSSSAFPPMSSKTPTPFSASSEGTKTGSTSSSSAFPSLPSKTPTHFSASGETRRLASLSQAQLGTGRVPLSMQDRLSEVAAQYAAAVKRMEERLEVLLQMKSKNDDSELKAAISTLAKNNHELLVSFSDIQSSLLQQKQRGIKMLSHKVTASMRANECEKYLASFLTSETDSASLLKVQPLDIESESRRREISSAVMTFQRSIIALKSRAKLMHELQDVDGDMRLLVSINETRKKLQGVEEDATRVERGIRNAVDCGQDIRIRLPSHRTTKDRSIQAGKGNYRNEVNWKDVENHLSTFSGLPRRTKLEMSLETQIVRKKSVDERQPRLSSTGKQHQKQLQLFSPPLSLHPRAGWDEPSTVDQAKMQALTYSAPSQLKSFAIDSAARGALSDFGTTPERVRDSFALSNRTGSLEARNESLSSKLPIGDLASKSPQSKLSESPLKKDGSKPSKIIDSPKESFKATFTLKNDADPPLSFSLPKDAPAETSEEKTFGLNSMHGLGTMLFTDSKNSGSKSSLFEIQPSGSDDQVDFHKLLTEFYTEHNASKLSEVPFVLSKYKGREGEMFAKLAKRYGVANPLEKQTDVSKSATKSNPLFSSEQAPNAQMPLQQKPPMSQSPFGNTKVASSASSFGSPGLSGSSIQDSKPVFGGFGNTSASNFGLSTTSSLSFGGNTVFSASQSPFSAPSSNTPFGSANAIQTQSTSAPMFNGKSARELLVEFYRNHNPAKVDEADRLLEKYHGNEEALFRNLAKKYNLDPSIFGLTSAPALAPGGFGSHSSLGTGGLGGSTVFGGVTSTPTPFGSSGFGSASPLGQSSVFGSAPVTASTTPSGSVFGAAAGSTSFGASGFGSLAQSSAGQGFGSLGSPQPTATFGASSPFGAPRR